MEKKQPHLTPSFHKLYTRDSTIKIPDLFMRQHGQDLSGKITLIFSYGRDLSGKISLMFIYGRDLSCKITLMFRYGNPVVVSVEMISERRERKCLYFNLRWADFVEENGVEEGDFLVFNFIGDETANVVVYDSSCCVKGLKVKKTQQVGSFTQKKRSQNEEDEESLFYGFYYTDSMICEVKRVKREAPQLRADFVEENGVEKVNF